MIQLMFYLVYARQCFVVLSRVKKTRIRSKTARSQKASAGTLNKGLLRMKELRST